MRYGAMEVLQREYGALLQPQSEPEYNVSLAIDLEQAPASSGALYLVKFCSFLMIRCNPEDRDAFILSIALFKRNALAAPFESAFKNQKQLEAAGTGQGELMQIHYRDEEAIYIQASPDRVTVIFSTVFSDETDRIYGKVFLQVRVLSVRSRLHTQVVVLVRNSLTLVVNPPFRMLRKFSTQIANLPWKFAT